MFYKISSKLDLHTFEVLVKSSKTLLIKLIALLCGILISIFLGQTLGSEGLGVFDFSIKI